MNKTRKSAVFITIAMLCLSPHAFAKVNPFHQAMALTTKYMPTALANMWQTEHLTWRAQLLYAACTKDFQAINQEIQSSFSLVHDHIIDQAILNGELIDESSKPALQDAAKLHYKIYSAAYRYGYVYRNKVIQKFHPSINPSLCHDAKEMAQQYPADNLPILPWQHTGRLKGVAWRENIFAMRIINKHFSRAYRKRQQKFSHIVDAQIYALITDNDVAYSAFSDVTQGYDFKKLLVQEISQAYQLSRKKKLPSSHWVSIYTQKAEGWATQAYVQSTISALRRIEELYPEIYQDIKLHMSSYIDLQLSTLEADKAQIKQLIGSI